MHKALVCSALVLGLALPALTSAATTASTGVSTTKLNCFDNLDGDNQAVGKAVVFYYRAVNPAGSKKVVKLLFDLPTKAVLSTPVVTLGIPMKGDCPASADKYPPKTGTKCQLQLVSAGVSHSLWACPRALVPAGSWRPLSLETSFGKAGTWLARFWAVNGSQKSATATIQVGIVP